MIWEPSHENLSNFRLHRNEVLACEFRQESKIAEIVAKVGTPKIPTEKNSRGLPSLKRTAKAPENRPSQ